MRKTGIVFLFSLLCLLFIGTAFSSWFINSGIETKQEIPLSETDGLIECYRVNNGVEETTPYEKYVNLEEAVTSANNNVSDSVQVNMYLTTGSFINVVNQKIVLNRGVSLYLPFDGKNRDISSDSEIEKLAGGFVDTNASGISSYNVSKFNFVNTQLTISEGAALYIGGKFGEKGVAGSYSQIDLDRNSNITVAGSFICYGYVKENDAVNVDQGNYKTLDYFDNSIDRNRYVEVTSGGYVKAPIVFYDAGGMSALTGLNSAGVFPVNTFELPNVQTYLKVLSGGTFDAQGRLFRKSGDLSIPVNEKITIVKPESSSENALLSLTDGYISFEYCPLNPGFTNLDASKNFIFINGTSDIGFIALEVSGQSLSTEDKFLPFSYKFYLVVGSNGNLRNSKYKIKMLAGSTLEILKGGILENSGSIIGYKQKSMEGINNYPTNFNDSNFIINGTLKNNQNSYFGGHITTESTDGLAVFDSSSVSQENLSVSSVEGLSQNVIKITTTGDFYDDSTGSIVSLLVKAMLVNSNQDGKKCWSIDGSLQSYTLRIIVNNINNYKNPILGYKVFTYDSQGNKVSLTPEGVYLTADSEYTLEKNSLYSVESLNRAESTEFTKQSGTSYVFESDKQYNIQSDTEISIYPGNGIMMRFEISGLSGSGGAVHKIYEKTNNDFYQIATFTGSTSNFMEIPIKQGATVRYEIKMGMQNFLEYSTGDMYLFDGLVDKMSSKSEDEMAGGTKIENLGSSTTRIGEVSNIQNECTLHQLIILKENPGCFTPETLVLLGNGKYEMAKNIKVGDRVTSFNHFTGALEETIVAYVDVIDNTSARQILELNFDNGQKFEIITEHGLFDLNLNKYVQINYDNVNKFIGHEFVFYNNDKCMNYESSKLVNYKIYNRKCKAYSIVSAYNLNIITGGYLSITDGIDGLYNIFDYGENLKYEEDLLASDIKKYGLFIYDDLKDYLTRDEFDIFGAKYWKVSIGKGYVTFERILEYIEKYLR